MCASDAEEGSLASSGKRGGVRRLLQRRLPVLSWARRYDRLAAAADAVAGLTLGLMLVPQSIAYAALADLPVQYGLYTAFMGTMLYTCLGTVKEVSIGPTSLMALMTLQCCRGLPVEFTVLLTFLSGCVVMLMALLRLGVLVELISPSVTSGFTSATAVIIVISQLKGLLGLRFAAETPWENAEQILARRHLVRYADLALGLVCCAALLLLRKLKDIKISPKRPVLRKTLWFVSIGRNALVVLAASVFAYCLHDPKDPIVKLSGVVQPGLPSLRLPAFSVTVDNSTLGFTDMVQTLGAGVVMVPVVMVLANIAIAKAFTTGGVVDASQEMLTLGLCNLAGSLVRAMPSCGAFTRSAVSHASGVRTPAAGLYSGVITLLALAFLTEWFYFIPSACLSAVLICAVIFMIDFDTVCRLWRESRSELCVLGVTFAVGVGRSVELAVPAGALASLALLLRRLMRARPHARLSKSAELEQRRSTLAEKLARKERKKEKKRKKLMRDGNGHENGNGDGSEMAEAVEASLGAELAARAGPSAADEDERRQDELRRRARDPPIVYEDIDGAAEFEKLTKALEGVALSAEEKQSLDELQQYLVQGEGSWVLGDDFLGFIARLLSDGAVSEEVRVAALRCLAAGALREDVALVLHQDRRHHALLGFAHDIDRRTLQEQLAIALFMCNLCSHVSSSEWLLYISEWDHNGQPLSNIRATTKVCVHAALSEEPALRELGTALMYNVATKEVKTVRLSAGRALRGLLPRQAKSKVFDEVCAELAMALLQLLQYSPTEEHLWRCVVSLARLAAHSQDVPQLISMVGPAPQASRGVSQRVDEQIDLIMKKLK